MKIGIFDSGVGGLLITKSITKALPQYSYHYLGDTARVPYGNRSQEAVYQFTCEAVQYLFRHECHLVLIACNTASAEALRRIQQKYLPAYFPERKVLGVLISAAEAATTASTSKRIGVLATTSTVASGAFVRELQKLDPKVHVFQQAAPLLVPLIENNGIQYARPILRDYLAPLLAEDIDALILGCTHYPFLEDQIKELVGPQIAIISQTRSVPVHLANYLDRHPEVRTLLNIRSIRQYEVTDLTPSLSAFANQLLGASAQLEKVSLY